MDFDISCFKRENKIDDFNVEVQYHYTLACTDSSKLLTFKHIVTSTF